MATVASVVSFVLCEQRIAEQDLLWDSLEKCSTCIWWQLTAILILLNIQHSQASWIQYPHKFVGFPRAKPTDFTKFPRSNQQKSLADAPWVGLWVCGSGRCWCAWVSLVKKTTPGKLSSRFGKQKVGWNLPLKEEVKHQVWESTKKTIMDFEFPFFSTYFFVNIFNVTHDGLLWVFTRRHDLSRWFPSTVLRQGKPGMKNEAFRWNRLWCLESNIQVDSKERFLLNDVAILEMI